MVANGSCTQRYPLATRERFRTCCAGSKMLMLLKCLALVSVSVFLTACSQQPATVNQPVVAQSPMAEQSPAPGQTPAATLEKYPALIARAQEVNDAFGRRDFARMVDLTYPKLVEAAGGRDKMISGLASGVKEMEAEGVTVLSSMTGPPRQIIEISGSIYAVLPTTLKVKAKDGIFQTESSMIGISSDQGTNWTFIDAGGKDRTQLKSLLPDAAEKLTLPPEREPVKISGN